MCPEQTGEGVHFFFGLQNALRRAIRTQYHQVRGFYDRKGKTHHLTANLPKHLFSRIESLIARDMAALIWRSKIAIPVTEAIGFELNALRDAFANTDIPWSISIGHIIPRDPQMTSLGDACGTGGGAYSHDLRYWFDVVWSQATCKLFMSRKVHINVLEFVIVILQLAAAITRETETGTPLQTFQPLEKLLIRCDNSPSVNWAHKVSAKSEKGQLFVHIFADLLDRTQFAVACSHIAGKDNNLADLLSRPPTHTLHSRHSRLDQIYLSEPRLRSYKFFRPLRELLSHLACRLSSEQWLENQPKLLGRFEAVDYTTSSFVTI